MSFLIFCCCYCYCCAALRLGSAMLKTTQLEIYRSHTHISRVCVSFAHKVYRNCTHKTQQRDHHMCAIRNDGISSTD